MPSLPTTRWPGIIETYRKYLSVTDATPVVSLQEGNTPLIEAPRLAAALGLEIELYLKFDGANPTGSFKDRGTAILVSTLAAQGVVRAIEDSSGNAGASFAAYATRAGIKARIWLAKRSGWPVVYRT